MTFGSYSYGSAAYAGERTIIRCSVPSANLIVMDIMLKVGTLKEIYQGYMDSFET